VADAPTPRFLAELIEHVWVHPNRDQLTGPLAERGPAHATHRPQLLGRRVWNIRKINPRL
jgi:hypothetical protein